MKRGENMKKSRIAKLVSILFIIMLIVGGICLFFLNDLYDLFKEPSVPLFNQHSIYYRIAFYSCYRCPPFDEHPKHPAIEYFQTKALSVLPTEKTAEIAIDYDGEILEEGLPVDISIVPEALNLIILRTTN